jgi:UPF0716 protein FxsA
MRRWVPWWVLALLFIVVPVLEIYLLIQVGQTIGAWWTVLLLVAAGLLGSWLVKREGSRAWRALADALAAGRMPARELADGALILIGGTLLLTPGFLSDLAGAFCILPFTRPLARRVLTRVVSRRLTGAVSTSYSARTAQWGPATARTRQRPGTDESVVRGEVVDEGQ